jgi:hypothetical protein
MPQATQSLTLKPSLHKPQTHHCILTVQSVPYVLPEDHIVPAVWSQVSVKCSQTQLLIFVSLRGVSTQLVLTTTCFGRYIDHHQAVHFPIIKKTIQYTTFLFLSTRSRSHLKVLCGVQERCRVLYSHNSNPHGTISTF